MNNRIYHAKFWHIHTKSFARCNGMKFSTELTKQGFHDLESSSSLPVSFTPFNLSQQLCNYRVIAFCNYP